MQKKGRNGGVGASILKELDGTGRGQGLVPQMPPASREGPSSRAKPDPVTTPVALQPGPSQPAC